VTACPTRAMYRREDGIIDFDKRICIGCKACMAACPYDAIFINPEDHCAEKCNLCSHRLDAGLEPACVTVCPTEAILVGDLNDPAAKVTQLINREAVQVRRPEKETRPNVFYKGAHQATLDPLAAARPEGGLYAWATQQDAARTAGTSSAAAVISYDIPHQAPWGWRVSLYTWTKSIAAGGFAVPAALAAAGRVSWTGDTVRWAAPLTGLVFLALTGGLLIWDLKRPMRFHLIFIKHQWRSWLVRGAVIVSLYGGALAAYLGAVIAGAGSEAQQTIAWIAMFLAASTAVYTAYLFAQAKARDMWQSPLLAPHLLVQAALAGAAVTPGGPARTVLAVAAVAHLALVAAEVTVPHSTAHARLAARELWRGKYQPLFWISALLIAAGIFVPPLALLGLLAYEHAYVQAGQCVALA